MTPFLHSRRKFIKTTGKLTLTTIAGSSLGLFHCTTKSDRPVVSIARIKNDDIEYAVEQAIDLLGGMNIVARNKDLIMLKPNLVTPNPACTTNPTVIQALARIMKRWL